MLFHLFIFYQWPGLKWLPILKTYNKIEVTYYPIKKMPQLSEIKNEEKNGKRINPDDKIQLTPKAIAKQQEKVRSVSASETKRDLADSIKGGLVKPTVSLKGSLEKPRFSWLETEKDNLSKNIPSEEKMLIYNKDKDLSYEPAYLNYYNTVRTRIYKIATANKPYYDREGEVRLVFTIAKNGDLVKVAIIKESSTLSPTLRNHALTSIKKASPFPPFLEAMKDGDVTLRLTISFEK